MEDTTPKEVLVTRRHWVADDAHPDCGSCGAVFSSFGGRARHHCRCCGELFCGKCSAYHRRLSPQAELDPNGVWERVCKGCYSKGKCSIAKRCHTIMAGWKG